MTLALLVALGTVLAWFGILALRWLQVRPITPDASTRAIFAAGGLSGAYVGGAYPIGWAMLRNFSVWMEQGATEFTFAGNLPPGVDEDDLLAGLVLGSVILVVRTTAEAVRIIRR
jgi:hypothetical protein